ncbi:adenine deaminase C-terminal domain-containing protein [Chloroflexota bacterium]
MPESGSKAGATTTEKIHELMKVALGEAEADLAIVGGDIVNVYTGEVLTRDTVLIKGDKIAYVGKNAGKSIGSSTQVIDASGNTLIPGFIDGHTHMDYIHSVSELLKYAIKSGTTTIITESTQIAFPLGYQGIIQFLKATKNQPLKIFSVAPLMATISPLAREHAITTGELRKLLRRKEVIGLGESYWNYVIQGDQRILDFIAETKKSGKKLDGHGAGARDNKLQAYISSGISSCHESTTVEEIMERLRLGALVLIREGWVRSELKVVFKIKDEKIDFRKLALSSDGTQPGRLFTEGYMESIVQKAIDLGFEPVTAIQMATINIAQHLGMDNFIGGIAPGKYADIVIIPDIRTIQPEYVISNGQVIAKNGQIVVQPRKHAFPKTMKSSVHLTRNFDATDFAIPLESNSNKARVRVIEQVTGLVTREAIMDVPVSDGLLQSDTSEDILKVAAIERTYLPGKTFVGFIRGTGLKRGAIATSTTWDTCDIIVVGTHEADMARAVNRLKELDGGIVVCDGNKILAEISLPFGGIFSTQPMEILAHELQDIQQAAANMGCALPDICVTLSVLSTPAIPYLRICEQGLVDIKQNRFVDLIVD